MNYDMGEPHPCMVAEEMRQLELQMHMQTRHEDKGLLVRIRELELEVSNLRQKNEHLEWSVATLRELAERPTWSE